MNYIVTTRREHFIKLGFNNFCNLEEMVLPKLLACDTETTGLKTYNSDLFAVQLGTGVDNYLIDITKQSNLVFEDIIPYLEGKTLVFHNSSFDLGFFYKHNYFHKDVQDTFLASKILYNGIKAYKHSFGVVMERELGIKYAKGIQKRIAQIQLNTTSAVNYCFNDVDKLIDLIKVLGKKLTKVGSIDSYTMHRKYIRALAYMEQCGLPASKEKFQAKVDKDKLILKEKRDRVVDYIYTNFPQFRQKQMDLFSPIKDVYMNLGSSDQMFPVFEAMGIPILNEEEFPPKKSIAEGIINKSDHEFVGMWLEYVSARHDVTTFGQKIVNKIIDGRIYTGYNPILDTARISSRGGGDVNTLNLPANQKTRECIEASDGFLLVGADYSGQENSVGADLHKDPVMVSSVINGDDLHCAFARVLFPELKNYSDEHIKEHHKKERSEVKSPRFALSYGGSSYTLMQNENIPLKRAEEIETAYKDLHHGIYEWADREILKAIDKGYLQHADGFRLILPFYKDLKKLEAEIQETYQFWTRYSTGKKEQIELDKAKSEEIEYEFKNEPDFEFYHEVRPMVRRWAKLRSTYYKLVLNSNVQGTAAMQTKKAAILLFDEIEKNDDYWKVRIAVIPHDEFLLEVVENLADKYSIILQDCMINGGNYYLKSGLFSMEAKSEIGKTWWDCH